MHLEMEQTNRISEAKQIKQETGRSVSYFYSSILPNKRYKVNNTLSHGVDYAEMSVDQKN